MTRYVTLSDIARATGRTLPIVSNWRRRYDDFPAPLRNADSAGGADQFDEAAIRAFLSRTSGAATKMGWKEGVLAWPTYVTNALWREPDIASDDKRVQLILLAGDLVLDRLTNNMSRLPDEELAAGVNAERGTRRTSYLMSQERTKTALELLATPSLADVLAAVDVHRGLRKDGQALDWSWQMTLHAVPSALYAPLRQLIEASDSLADEVWGLMREGIRSPWDHSCRVEELLTDSRRSPRHIDRDRRSMLFEILTNLYRDPDGGWEHVSRLFLYEFGDGNLLRTVCSKHLEDEEGVPGLGTVLKSDPFSSDDDLSDVVVGWTSDASDLIRAQHRLWHVRAEAEDMLGLTLTSQRPTSSATSRSATPTPTSAQAASRGTSCEATTGGLCLQS